MFVRVTADPAPRPTSLGELGIGSDSNPKVSLNEFTYKKGVEIYGEKEPADYVYQVKIGAVRSYKLLSDGRRQIGAFHLVGDISDWRMGRAPVYGGGDRQHHGTPDQAAQPRDGG
jgi:CRP/FNR family nitrogen fixation transcriptional regulator